MMEQHRPQARNIFSQLLDFNVVEGDNFLCSIGMADDSWILTLILKQSDRSWSYFTQPRPRKGSQKIAFSL
jgi:hypothetical protein